MTSLGFHKGLKEVSPKDDNRTRFDYDDDDDDEDWISLSTEEDGKHLGSEKKTSSSSTVTINMDVSNKKDHPNICYSEPSNISVFQPTEKSMKMPNTHDYSEQNCNNIEGKSLEIIQFELEKKIHFQKKMIQDPLHSYPLLFIKHLIYQTWKLHIRIRLGLICIFIGSFLYFLQSIAQFKSLFLIFFFLLAIILTLGYLYFYQWHDMVKLHATESRIQNVRLIFLLLLYVPTFMEVQSYLMFVNLLMQNHYPSSPSFSTATNVSLEHELVCGWFCNRTRSWLWVLCLVIIQTLCIYYWRTASKFSYKKCHRYTRIRLLQILTFLVSIYYFKNGYAYIHLGGPFFMSLGFFFISSVPSSSGSSNDVNKNSNDTNDDHDQMEWVSQIIRLSLRLTLRDVLSNLGDNIAEDQMLQITMLRWIVDYWAYQYQTKGEKQQHTKNETHDNQSTEFKQRPSTSNQTEKSVLPESCSHSTILKSKRTDIADNAAFKGSNTDKNDNLNDSSISQEHNSSSKKMSIASSQNYDTSNDITSINNITWDDLFEMLSTTTDLMKSEINHHSNSENYGKYTAAPNFNSSSSTSSMKTDLFPSSIENLKSLLSTIDVNNQARPAVQAYKHTIYSLPPSNQMCENFAAIKKCPAIISIFILFLFSSFYIDIDVVGITNKEQILLKSVILIPSLALEVIRILRWYDSIHQLEKNDTYGMTLLLSTNTDVPHIMIHYKPSTLLKVWCNLCNSTVVLEQGLKGIKCAQTSFVVRDFCNNAASLAGLGFEVYKKGWVHGAGVIATEVFTSIGNKKMSHPNDQNDRTLHFEKGTYMKDAVDIVKNGSLVIQNLSELIDTYVDEEGKLHPAIDGLLFVTGKGWLWGKQNETENDEMKNDEDPDDCDTNDETKYSKSTHVENKLTNLNDDNSISMLLKDAISETMRLNERMKKVEDFSKQSFNQEIKRDSHSGFEVDDKDGTNTEHYNSSSQELQKVDDIAGLLELTANAFVQNLITEGEKDNIMEMILHAKQNNESNDVLILENIRKSLQQYINSDDVHSDNILVNAKHEDVCLGNKPKSERDSNDNPKNKNGVRENSINDLDSSLSDDMESKEMGSSISTEENEENNVYSLRGSIQHISLDKKPDNSQKVGNFSGKDREQSCNLCSSNFISDDDFEEESWTTIVNDLDEKESIKKPSLMNDKTMKNLDKQVDHKKEEKDNLLHAIGSGLAVLGAVVGGLAVLSANSKDDDKKKNVRVTKDGSNKTEHHYNSSKVIIEELDEED